MSSARLLSYLPAHTIAHGRAQLRIHDERKDRTQAAGWLTSAYWQEQAKSPYFRRWFYSLAYLQEFLTDVHVADTELDQRWRERIGLVVLRLVDDTELRASVVLRNGQIYHRMGPESPDKPTPRPFVRAGNPSRRLDFSESKLTLGMYRLYRASEKGDAMPEDSE